MSNEKKSGNKLIETFIQQNKAIKCTRIYIEVLDE